MSLIAPAHPAATGPRAARALRAGGRGLASLAHGLPARVHSVFARTLNLGWADGRLLALHGPGPLAAPFAAALDGPIPRGVAVGLPVTAAPGGLRLGGWHLALDQAVPVDLGVRRDTHGLDRLRAAVGGIAPGAPALASPIARAACDRLREGIRRGDPEALTAGARALIGLGEGLTPAGDDLVVGVLAVLWRAGRPGTLTAPARAGIALAAATRTTDVARAFLRAALDGEFAEPLRDLVAATSTASARARAARVVAGVGGTSGADTLAGVRLALDALPAPPA